MAPRTKEIPGYFENIEVALDNGLSYSTYYRRCVTLGYSPEEAATLPHMKSRRSASPNSITERCRQAGISRGRYYDILSELDELGIEEFNVGDVIDIALARKKA